MFYRFINNRRVNLLIAILLSGIFVVLELFYSIPVILEALLFSLIIMFFMVTIFNSGEMTDDQIREALETMANAHISVSAYAAHFLGQYLAYEKRMEVISTIEYMDNRTTSLVKSITFETGYFINCRLRKVYGELLIVNNRELSEEDNIRIQGYKDSIDSMINKLDDIALAINEYGDSIGQYKKMNVYLNDKLESIRECNKLLS